MVMKATVPAKLDLTQLVVQHYATVWRYLRLLGCDSSLAEDLCQETFLSVLEKPLVELNEKATAAYLRMVAKNLFVDEVRRRRKAVPSDLDQADVAWEEVERNDAGQTWVEALRGCLQSLAGRPRQAIELQYRERFSVAAIAQSLGMKESGVKTLLGRAKRQLRDCVERKVAAE